MSYRRPKVQNKKQKKIIEKEEIYLIIKTKVIFYLNQYVIHYQAMKVRKVKLIESIPWV